MPRYQPLNHDAGEIRLVQLLPETNPDKGPILLEMFSRRLEDADLIALSYCWGEDEAKHEVNINGEAVLIRSNLHNFFMQLLKRVKVGRDTVVLGPYWIDALCINQGDIEEKNREVKRMDQIYSKADLVLVWLGEVEAGREGSSTLMAPRESNQPDPSRAAQSHVHDVRSSERQGVRGVFSRFAKRISVPLSRSREVSHQKAMRVVTTMGHEAAISVTKESLQNHLVRAACDKICELLMQPYFTRAWCTQEVALASEVAIFYGESTLYWSTLVELSKGYFDWNAIREELQLDDRLSQLWSLDDAYPFWSASPFARVQFIESHRHMAAQGSLPSLLQLLIGTSYCKSHHPIDKIYSLWSLAKDASTLLPNVDYRKSAASVFTEFSRAWIALYGELDVISTASVRTSENAEPMPSWVTDWSNQPLSSPLISFSPDLVNGSKPTASNTLAIYRADGEIGMSFAFDESRIPSLPWAETLIAAGLTCDVIEVVGEMHTTEAGPLADWRDMVRQAARKRGVSNADPKLWAEFWTAMHVGRDPKGAVYNVDPTVLQRGKDGTPSLPIQSEAWSDHLRRATRGRRLAVTRLGALALVTHGRAGDELCVLFGCSVPLVLRRYTPYNFELLGDAYICGWMEGQMIQRAGGLGVVRAKMPGVNVHPTHTSTQATDRAERDDHTVAALTVSEDLAAIMREIDPSEGDTFRTVVPPEMIFTGGQSLSNPGNSYSVDLTELSSAQHEKVIASFNQVSSPVTSITDVPEPMTFYIR